jgi:type I restriction enzyme S subunit
LGGSVAAKGPLSGGWHRVRLGDYVTKIGSGITPLGGHASYVNTGIPLIRSQNVHFNNFVDEGLAHISAEQDARMEGTRVLPGDVLLNITGASIGRVCVVPERLCPANVNQHVSIIRCKAEIHPQFLSFYISTPEFQRFITDTQAGATRQALTKALIENFRIPLPTPEEQRRIVANLSEQTAAVERARAAAETQLQAAKALPAAYLRAVFESPEARRWPESELGELCDIRLGKMLSPASKLGLRPRPYLRNANVQWGGFQLDDVLTMDFTEEQERKFALRPGDLLVCEGGEPGRAAVWEGQLEPCLYQKALHRLRPRNSAVDPHFVMYRLWTGSLGGEFTESHAKTTIAHLPAVRLERLRIPVPPLATQQRIAAMLNEQTASAERACRTIEDELETINKVPAALLRRAFEGEL